MSGRYENVDGHRVWTESPTPSVAPEDAPRPDDSDQRQGGAALPTFDVHAGYVMRADTIALHFPVEYADDLMRHPLLCGAAEKIRAAQVDVQQEADWQQDRAGAR